MSSSTALSAAVGALLAIGASTVVEAVLPDVEGVVVGGSLMLLAIVLASMIEE